MQDRTGRVPRVYHTLDGLRGIAALAVVGYHSWGSALHNLLPRAYLAVDLFFIMSGVVIAAAYDDRIARGLGTAGFMAARLRRLYPLYLLATAIGIAGAAYAGKPLAAWPYALAMLPAPGGQRLYPFDGAAWSLFFELAANLVFVALHPRLTTRVLAAVVAVSAVLLAALEISGGWLNYGYAWFCFTPGIARVGFWLLWRRAALPARAARHARAGVGVRRGAAAPRRGRARGLRHRPRDRRRRVADRRLAGDGQRAAPPRRLHAARRRVPTRSTSSTSRS